MSLVKSRALKVLLLVLFLSSFYSPAQAAECSTTSSSYTGNGTNGASNTNYVVLAVTQIGSCTWTVPSGVTAADVLVVGGGGGGAGGFVSYNDGAGGGGGGGAYRADAYPLTPGNSISIVVGAGGKGGDTVTAANRDQSRGLRGSASSFGVISGGGGGGAGYITSGDSQTGMSGTAGGGGGGSTEFWNAYNNGGACVSTYYAAGGTGVTATIGAKTYTGVAGGVGGIYCASSTNGASGGGRSDATSSSTGAPGAGLTDLITGTSVEYGRGGIAKGATGWSNGLAALGIGFGGNGSIDSLTGTSGGNGIVYIRMISAKVNSFALTGNATTAIYRTPVGITVNAAVASKVSFSANGKRIPNCLNIATTGTSPNITATCNWSPNVIGRFSLSASVTPNSGGLGVTTGPISVTISRRTTNR